jgi:hypothetical protein
LVQQKRQRVQRFLVAALFSVTTASSEALKIIAGFGQDPDGSQWLSLSAVVAVAAALGWVAAPALEPLKKISSMSVSSVVRPRCPFLVFGCWGLRVTD